LSLQTHGYDVRSLKHEERMLSLYRRATDGDAGLLQPLANSCVRAAAFEWVLTRDSRTVQRLWKEAARALALGFTRKPEGFDPSPDQFILAINLAIAAQEGQAFSSLARLAPGVRSTALQGAQAFRGARGQFHLAESYALISGAILERNRQPAFSAIQALEAAAASHDDEWWQQRFPDASEAAWLAAEQKAICQLLSTIIKFAQGGSEEDRQISTNARAGGDPPPETCLSGFQAAMDDVLVRLNWYVDSDPDHHPKLYLWLPGIALCRLAIATGLPIDWVVERQVSKPAEYSRLPVELLSGNRPPESQAPPTSPAGFPLLKS
jgi:hypothetical protein